MEGYKRSGQIPPFGNWEHANEMPITQYFQCARQAGLSKYSSACVTSGDLYTADSMKSSRPAATPRKTRVREKRSAHAKEHRKQGRVCDVTEPPRKQAPTHKAEANYVQHYEPPSRPKMPKPVDEDLYKIPSELLHTSKRKKKLGFFSRCLVPACAA